MRWLKAGLDKALIHKQGGWTQNSAVPATHYTSMTRRTEGQMREASFAEGTHTLEVPEHPAIGSRPACICVGGHPGHSERQATPSVDSEVGASPSPRWCGRIRVHLPSPP